MQLVLFSINRAKKQKNKIEVEEEKKKEENIAPLIPLLFAKRGFNSIKAARCSNRLQEAQPC